MDGVNVEVVEEVEVEDEEVVEVDMVEEQAEVEVMVVELAVLRWRLRWM